MGITPGPSGELGGASASSHTPFHGDMVKIRVAIEEQLRRISQSQVQNGTVVGLAFATTRELVVRHGRAYIIRPLPRGRWSHEPQACYANALHAAIARKWVYVEGFAIPKSGGLAVLHAWVSNPQNSGVAYDRRGALGANTLAFHSGSTTCSACARKAGMLAFWTFGNWAGHSSVAKTESKT